MTDARKRAEEALAFMDAALLSEMPPLPTQVKALADSVRALLASEPAKGACADCGGCGGLGWIPAGDEQLGCIDCNGKGTIEPAPPAGAEVARLTALLRECNAVCLCGCPESEHESYGEDGESCADEGHECIRVAPAVLEIVQRYRVALSDALRAQPTPPPSDAVREAAEVVRTILTAHDARLSESGVLTYGPPSKGTGFVAAIQWLRRYDAARGGE